MCGAKYCNTCARQGSSVVRNTAGVASRGELSGSSVLLGCGRHGGHEAPRLKTHTQLLPLALWSGPRSGPRVVLVAFCELRLNGQHLCWSLRVGVLPPGNLGHLRPCIPRDSCKQLHRLPVRFKFVRVDFCHLPPNYF